MPKTNFSKKISLFSQTVILKEKYLKKRAESLFKNLDIRLKTNSNDKLNEYVNFFNSNINGTKNATRKVIFCEPKGTGYGNRLYTFF